MKASAYQSLTSKIAQIDDEAQAKELIEQIPDKKSSRKRAHRNNLSQPAIIAKTANSTSEKLIDKKNMDSKTRGSGNVISKGHGKKDHETIVNLMKMRKVCETGRKTKIKWFDEIVQRLCGSAREAVPHFDDWWPDKWFCASNGDFEQTYNQRTLRRRASDEINSNSWDKDSCFVSLHWCKSNVEEADLNQMSSFSRQISYNDARTITLSFCRLVLKRREKGEDNDNFGGRNYFDY